MMKVATRLAGPAIAALLAASGVFLAPGFPGTDTSGLAWAASAQQKNQARQSLDRVMSSLRAVDTAYASGNSAEARTRFQQARSSWNNISPVISSREAREAQLLFQSLDGKLKSGAPATEVRSTVSGMLEEFREDIERELR
jgi:hypothetical protein